MGKPNKTLTEGEKDTSPKSRTPVPPQSFTESPVRTVTRRWSKGVFDVAGDLREEVDPNPRTQDAEEGERHDADDDGTPDIPGSR